MNIKINFLRLIIFSSFFFSQLLFSCDPDNLKKITNAIDLENINGKYNVIFDRNTEYEWKYFNVDSFASSSRHGVLIYGLSISDSTKKWFLITGGKKELKKEYGGWYDNEFRKYRLNEIDQNGDLHKTLISTDDLWNWN